MRKYFLFFIFIFISCSQSFIEETQNVISVRSSVSNDLDTGILLKWDTQWDFARIEVLRGEDEKSLSVFKNHLVQNEWLDSETKPGYDYYYQIQAYNSKDRMIGKSSIVKGYRNYRNIQNVVQPKGLSTVKGDHVDKIELYWVGDVLDVFKVYRSSQLDGPYNFIAEIAFEPTEELTFVDQNLKPSSIYFYKVSAVGFNSDTKLVEQKYMDTPKVVEGSTKYAPTGLKASKESMVNLGGIELTWDMDSSAKYYQLYRADKEKGDYQLIVPLVVDEEYIDNSLPNKAGSMVGGFFEYPSYFYKVKSITSGKESELSASAEGRAINPVDILDAPESFELTLDKSSYPYKLNFSWDPVSSSTPIYRLSKINEQNITNLIQEISQISITLPNEAFNTRWEYIVQVLNPNAGNRPSLASSKSYVSATPAPPTIISITTNARIEITNETDTNAETHIYWSENQGSWWNPNWVKVDSMTGLVKRMWHITPEVGFIDLTWQEGVVSEDIEYYTLFRRGQGEEFTVLKDNLSVQELRDEEFTPEQYLGTGTGASFAYPMYEYQITATFAGQESAPSSTVVGSAINPDDILLAPDYVSVPFHWAAGKGFNTTILEGAKSPLGIEKVAGESIGSKNTMYLTWEEVDKASTYSVEHSRGQEQLNWYPHRDIKGNNKDTKIYLNNEGPLLGDDRPHMTSLYTATDGLFNWSPIPILRYKYSIESASFQVAPINGKAGFLRGETRGIWFIEPADKPAYYKGT